MEDDLQMFIIGDGILGKTQQKQIFIELEVSYRQVDCFRYICSMSRDLYVIHK